MTQNWKFPQRLPPPLCVQEAESSRIATQVQDDPSHPTSPLPVLHLQTNSLLLASSWTGPESPGQCLLARDSHSSVPDIN